MKLKHLIYASTPVAFNDSSIQNILLLSQDNNAKNNITGALIYRFDLYLQFLEGPEIELDRTYKRIKEDRRHNDIHQLKESATNRRVFASWAMRGDPAMTWMWSPEDVEKGLVKSLSEDESFEIFNRISREVDQFN